MPKRNRKKIQDRPILAFGQYAGLRIFSALIHIFPMDWSYVTCKIIGDLLYRLDRTHRQRAIRHLQLSFPDWSEDKIKHTAKLSMRHMMFLGLEMMFTTRLITIHRWQRHVDLKHMQRPLRMLVEKKRGMIFLAGHFGNWEAIGYMTATLGFPTVSVARTLDNPFIQDYILGVRERTGQKIIDKRGASDMMHDLLTQKTPVSFIADQDAGRKGVFVNFFGRQASAYKTIALLALRYDVPILVGYGRRLGETYRFEMGIERIIEPEEWKNVDDPVKWITQEYTSSLERIIRTAPEQYFWVHRRWKHRPKGQHQPADGIA